MAHSPLRHDWQLDEVIAIHDTPLFELLDRARAVHCREYPGGEVQLCSLVSVKTGACPEDCGYCSQSVHHSTHVAREPMLDVDQVLERAKRAKAAGSSRLCMSAAWREVDEGPEFERVLEMVRGVKALGLEACCTLGMLTDEQAARLKEAGLDAYNHNLDTSRNYYEQIVTTRRYEERLETLQRVRRSGITICSGGIIGMGESIRDRCALLVELASFDPHPEAVPINALVPIPGTPLESQQPVEPVALARVIATARILLPRAKVRLSAGRTELSREAQLLCLFAGANSIFIGDQLLTTPNPDMSDDRRLLEDAGLVPMPLR
ncbi:MAG: biotin synthase BioB [Deltaproteobacteria bacterium]|nr:biotin synthase BioB [Deltaproteobacteria bacterium]